MWSGTSGIDLAEPGERTEYIMAFEYDERGYLVVDGVYTDPRFPTMDIVRIGGGYYRVMATRIMESGENLAKRLAPLPAYQPPASLEPAVMAMAIMRLKCAFRDVPEDLLTIGRAITDDELEEFMAQNGIGPDDISEPFKEVEKAVYGKRYETIITVRQARVSIENSITLEGKLRRRGIHAFSGAPGRLNIRVK